MMPDADETEAEFPRRPAAFVLHAGVTAAWGCHRLSTPYTRAVLRRVTHLAGAVPSSWAVDLADVVRREERRKAVTRDDIDFFMRSLGYFTIHVDPGLTTDGWDAGLNLARRHRLTACTAAYLELARRLGLPLAAEDPALVRAAPAAGVDIFRP